MRIAIAPLLLLIGAVAYYGTRHMLRENDEVVIRGRLVPVHWTEVAPPPAGLGITAQEGFITNLPISAEKQSPGKGGGSMAWHGRQTTQYVEFASEHNVRIDEALVARTITNVFGQQVQNWTGTIHGAISTDANEVCVSLEAVGGGDAGSSVVLAGEIRPGSRLQLTITERLWQNSARQCRLEFQFNPDGTTTYIGEVTARE